MGVTINKKSTTTEPPPKNGQQPKPPGPQCILLVPNPRPRFGIVKFGVDLSVLAQMYITRNPCVGGTNYFN